MTPAELHKIAELALQTATFKTATFTAETRGTTGELALEIMAYAQISAAASLALLARPLCRRTFGEYEHDETAADREETWSHDPDAERARELRRDRD